MYMYLGMHMSMCSKYFSLTGVCNQKHLQTTIALNTLVSCAASDSMSQLTKGFDIHSPVGASQ